MADPRLDISPKAETWAAHLKGCLILALSRLIPFLLRSLLVASIILPSGAEARVAAICR